MSFLSFYFQLIDCGIYNTSRQKHLGVIKLMLDERVVVTGVYV